MGIVGPDIVSHQSQMVGDTDLRKHTPKNLVTPVYSLCIIQRMGLTELRNEGVRTVNRTREQSWKEGNIRGELHHIPTRFDVLAMDLYQIADQLCDRDTS